MSGPRGRDRDALGTAGAAIAMRSGPRGHDRDALGTAGAAIAMRSPMTLRAEALRALARGRIAHPAFSQ